jgi:hypothetical protein
MDRATKLMEDIWEDRNSWADTEEKLVSAVIKRTSAIIKSYVAEKMNNLTVLDKNDMLKVSEELEALSK